MEKQKMDLSSLQNESVIAITKNEITIRVKPYINMDNKQVIIASYFSDYDVELINGYIKNQYGLILAIIDTMTDLDVENVNIDKLVDTGLWAEIKTKIKNLDELYQDIKNIEKSIIESDSLENNLKPIVKSVKTFLQKLSDLNLDKESIAELGKSLDEQIGKLREFYPQIKENPSESEVKKRKSRKSTT